MPLQLTINIEASSSTAFGTDISTIYGNQPSTHSSRSDDRIHCFIQLPTDVANSLNTIEPYAALVILQVRHVRTSRQIYVAWDGGTTSPSQLGLHQRFAAALDFHNGDAVSASIVERVVTTPRSDHDTALRTAFVKPYSYEQSSKHDLHQQDYQALSLTAESLQDSFLSCVRVLFPGLCFPLALPARNDLLLQVTSIDTYSNDRGNGVPYAIVCPESRIEIEPPPLEPTSNKKNKPFYTRVVRVSRSKLTGLSSEILNTHAILNSAHSNSQPVSHTTTVACLLVSRKGGEKYPNSNIAVPVRVIQHASVPTNSIYLPPMIWQRLQLLPLTPVLVEPISISPRDRISTIPYLDATHRHDEREMFATISGAAKAGAVFYDGMQTQEGIVRIFTRSQKEDRNYPITFPPLLQPWKDSMLKKPEVSDLVHIDCLNDPLFYEDVSHRHSINTRISRSLLNNRVILEPKLATLQPKLSLIDIPDNEDTTRPLVIVGNPADGMPLRDEKIRNDLIQFGTPSIQRLVSNTLQAIKQWAIKHNDEHKSFAIAVEGLMASGRTYACKLLGSILQDVEGMRNIWIHGRKCMTEDVSLRLLRLYEAFQAACDEGPGVIIIDDFDLFSSSEKIDPSEKLGGKNSKEQKEECQVIAEWLYSLSTCHHRYRKHSVILVLVCERADDLVQMLRTPGLILHVASVQACSLEDRAFLFFKLMLAMYMKMSSTLQRPSDEKEELKEKQRIFMRKALSIAHSSDGYCVKDIFNSVNRAELKLKCDGLDRSTELSGNEELLSNETLSTFIVPAVEDAFRAMTPLHQMNASSSLSTGNNENDSDSQMKRVENKSSETEEEKSLTWERLGGVAKIRETLQEVLELWVRNESILGMIPIRLTRGVLLYGPPGNGKTKIALTAAKQAGLSTIFVKGAELLGKYVGQSESGVRRVFERASSSTSHVIIFDEFDALASARGDSNAGVGDRVVNTLLACMDGVDRSVMNNVFVIATSSRPQIIDRALLRPGRLDKWIKVDFPLTHGDRMNILHCCFKASFSDIGSGISDESIKEVLDKIAADSHGYSAADLEAIVNDALNSLLENEEEWNEEHVDENYGSHNGSRPPSELGHRQIVNALKTAWKSSRPSLSANQRSYYAKTMARFSGEEDLADQVGQKLMLK